MNARNPHARPLRGLRAAFLALGGVALLGCSSKPPVPDWQMTAHDAAHKAVAAYLSGNSRVEKLEFERARSETARTGQPALLARIELLRCAAQVASLDFGACEGFEALREDAGAPEKAYANYLAGRIEAHEVELLPPAQQGMSGIAPSSAAAALQGLDDPLSRLVAAGVLLQIGRADPAAMKLATQTASAQGWRRPLLAWLLVQVQRAEAAGDTQETARLQRRIALVERNLTAP